MFGKILNFLDKILTWFEEWTLFITVIVALVALFVNVVLRYGFNYSLAWSEELVREVIIYTTFIGCSAAVKNRSMIKIDALVQLVPALKTLSPISAIWHLDFFHHDDVLWLADGGDAVSNTPKNHHFTDSAGLFVCDFATHGRDDVYSDDSGDLSGYH